MDSAPGRGKTIRNILKIAAFALLGLSLMGSTVPCSSGHQDFAEFAILAQRHNVPVWSNDGSNIVFSRFPSGAFVVQADGSRMWPLPPDSPITSRIGNFASAVSPDGTRVAYAMVNRSKNTSSIVTSNLDGSDLRRLTNDNATNMYPAWSPDGSQVAFLSGKGLTVFFQLFIMDSDGSDLRKLETSVGLWPTPPVWSPDGKRLAFVAWDWHPEGGKRYTLHTIQPNGSGLTSLGESASGATWSPDGTRIAFIAKEGGIYTLVTMNPDGTDRDALSSFKRNDQAFFDNVSWSPDGSQILYGSSDLYSGRDRPVRIVGISGSNSKNFAWPDVKYEIVSAAWSPDGSRIAFHMISEDSDVVLYTTTQDGSDERILVRGNDRSRAFPRPNNFSSPPDVRLVAENSDWRNVSADGTACSDGRLVSDPDQNPGLVQDCKTLLSLRNALAGDAVLHLNWTANVPMSRWTGVEIEGLPPRVVELDLPHFRPTQLNGIIPPELGKLANLTSLNFWGNALSGTIPSELGNLANLAHLNLRQNHLRGDIPAELGSLTRLETLVLNLNALEGVIPPELGNLSNLKEMIFTGNNLSGPVPSELGKLRNLMELYLRDNELTGCIPSELHSHLTRLTSDGLGFCEDN